MYAVTIEMVVLFTLIEYEVVVHIILITDDRLLKRANPPGHPDVVDFLVHGQTMTTLWH